MIVNHVCLLQWCLSRCWAKAGQRESQRSKFAHEIAMQCHKMTWRVLKGAKKFYLDSELHKSLRFCIWWTSCRSKGTIVSRHTIYIYNVFQLFQPTLAPDVVAHMLQNQQTLSVWRFLCAVLAWIQRVEQVVNHSLGTDIWCKILDLLHVQHVWTVKVQWTAGWLLDSMTSSQAAYHTSTLNLNPK